MLKNLLYSAVIVWLLFARFFLVGGQAHNVFYMMTTGQEITYIYLSILVLILFFTLVLAFINQRFPQSYKRAVSALLLITLLPLLDLIAFIAGCKTGAEGAQRIIYPLICLSYVPGIIVLSLFVKIEKVVLKLMPVFITLMVLVIYYSIPRAIATHKVESGYDRSSARTPIHFIIFDGSSVEVLQDARYKDLLANFTAFAQQSYVFYEVYSPGFRTIISIPKILTGREYADFREHYYNLLVADKEGAPLQKLRTEGNIFELAQANDYNTILIGGHLPYNELFGENLNYGAQYRSCPLFNYLPPWPYSKVLYFSRLKKNIFYAEFADYQEKIKSVPENSFFFTHFLIPHWPNIFDVEGPGAYYWTNLIHGEKYRFEERFVAQTRYCDIKFGEIVELLKSQGRFEESLIILTSDHDKDGVPNPLRVPLYIKAPFQNQEIAVMEKCNIINLLPFLEEYLENQRIDVTKLYE